MFRNIFKLYVLNRLLGGRGGAGGRRGMGCGCLGIVLVIIVVGLLLWALFGGGVNTSEYGF